MKANVSLYLILFVLLVGCTSADTASVSANDNNPQAHSQVSSTNQPTQLTNKYKLTTETIYTEAYNNEIEPYWKKYGKEGEFSGVDNVKIKYMSFIRDNEKGAIVISSGRTEGYIKYHELVYDLGKQGYSIYIMDHRGQGFSGRMKQDKHKGYVKNFDDYVKDFKTFVDNVVKAKSHKNLFLLAHSMGGGIATLYIETYPTDFKAAALSSPMHEPGNRLLFVNEGCAVIKETEILDIGEPRYVGDIFDLLGFLNHYNRPACKGEKDDLTHSVVRCNKIADLYDEFDQAQLGAVTAHWAAEACRNAEKFISEEATKNIKIPVLVMQAGDDTAVENKGQIKFCNNLSSSTRGQYQCFGGAPQVIRDAYHELFIEKDEYRIPALTQILDFFEENIH